MGFSESCYYFLGVGIGYVIGKNSGIDKCMPRLNACNRDLAFEKEKINNYDKFIKSKGLIEEYKFFSNNIIINNDIYSNKNNSLSNYEITIDNNDKYDNNKYYNNKYDNNNDKNL
jgi:hypothetical protein